jgi:hypothetical protein
MQCCIAQELAAKHPAELGEKTSEKNNYLAQSKMF